MAYPFKVVEVEPGSDDWDALRRGRITASRIGDVMSPKMQAKDADGEKLFDADGEPVMVHTKRFLEYQREIVLELLGHTEVDKTPEWYQHGREMEPRGLDRYAWKYGDQLERNVLLIHKDYDWLSCSPDSLVVKGGKYVDGVEMKSRKLYKNYRAAIRRTKKFAEKGQMAQAIEPGYRWQVQASMLITGWDRWFYTNYYEDNDVNSQEYGEWRIGRCAIPRDQGLIDKIEERALLFMTECYRLAEQQL